MVPTEIIIEYIEAHPLLELRIRQLNDAARPDAHSIGEAVFENITLGPRADRKRLGDVNPEDVDWATVARKFGGRL